jgi:hypothetical protein
MLAHLKSDFLSRQKKVKRISKKIRQLELDAGPGGRAVQIQERLQRDSQAIKAMKDIWRPN